MKTLYNINIIRDGEAWRKLLLVVVLPFVALTVHGQVKRIGGQVTSNADNKPIAGVNVIDPKTKRVLAVTDEDGKFAFDFYPNGTIRFQMLGCEPVTEKVRDRDFIPVVMSVMAVEVDEAVVVAKRERKKIKPEPTTLEVKGNWLTIKDIIRIPDEIFHANSRLVVQPILYNETRKEQTLMKPIVFDAQEYNYTQNRMYDYGMRERDPLGRFVEVKSKASREKKDEVVNDTISYADSIYVVDETIHDYYICKFYMALEDYQKIYYNDTDIVAQGTVNPLRFMEYNFKGAALNDSAYIPKVEKQLRDTHGDINLRFALGKSNLDATDAQNATELGKLNAQLTEIAAGRDTHLQSFSILGTASPDGSYTTNKRLAESRMQNALDYIVGRLDEDTRSTMEVSSDARVASWTDVADLLRADSLFDEAAQVEAVVNRNSSQDAQTRELRRTSLYSLLLSEYCPRLRRVEYQLQYSIFRQLTLEEIQDLYRRKYITGESKDQLSRYEFYRLFRTEQNDTVREVMLRRALDEYPKFTLAASDLAELLIKQRRPNSAVTKPFAGPKAPKAINLNHVVALLAENRFSRADTIASYLPTDEDTRLVKATVGMLNGEFEDNYEIVAASSPLNAVVALLAVKHNDEALARAKELPTDQALTHYLLATCYNRKENVTDAIKELETAFRLDPSLKETAKLDGDLNRLINILKK